jgi:autoinducer 2 (AI-2) kinase
MTRRLLTLDAGTSGGRAAIFDAAGRLIGVASQPWRYTTPAEAAPWGRAFDPDEFWAILCGLTRQVLAKTATRPAEILAVSATSQRQGIVLLDAAGEPLYAGPNMDLRGVYQAAEIDTELGPLLYRITGHRPALMFAPARLRWLREHRPDLYDRLATLLMISDWLVYCLTGERCSEPSAAAESQLLDIAAGSWSETLIKALELPSSIFPPLRQAGEVAGRVTHAAAAMTGLNAGTPVVVGGADTQCGLLGMGIVAPGQMAALAGWSLPLQQVISQPPGGVCDETAQKQQTGLWFSRHLLPGRWVLESNAGPLGRSYEWLRETVFCGADYAELDRLAETASPGAEGAMAFFSPPSAMNETLGLAWGGLLVPLALDFIDGRREHLARASLESLAFAMRANLEQLVEASGQRPDALSLGGGLTRSRIFPQLVADVLGLPVQVAATPETSSAGAAMCAAVGAGLFDDLTIAATHMTHDRTVCRPGRVAHAEYLDAYERWQAAQRHLTALSRSLS